MSIVVFIVFSVAISMNGGVHACVRIYIDIYNFYVNSASIK